MTQLEFDQETAGQLDAAYRARDVVRRRKLVRAALGAQTGDRVLDVGCGPGYYVAELLEEVGPRGAVVGLDAAPAMLAIAQERCKGATNATFRQADATVLPIADTDFDRALIVQVLEYVADVPAVLAELRRVLRPGGRLVVWDTDWSTLSWYSADPARMARARQAWDRHLVHRALPQTLASQLRVAGFTAVQMDGHAFATAVYDPESFGVALLPLIEDYLPSAGMDRAEARAWSDEQRALGENGAFYFSVTQCCFTATRPKGG